MTKRQLYMKIAGWFSRSKQPSPPPASDDGSYWETYIPLSQCLMLHQSPYPLLDEETQREILEILNQLPPPETPPKPLPMPNNKNKNQEELIFPSKSGDKYYVIRSL